MTGLRYNKGKPPLWLVTWSSLSPLIRADRRNLARTVWLWCRRELIYIPCDLELVRGASYVLQFGTRKYSAYNWEQGLSFTETVSCALRHAVAPDEIDHESGLAHLQHLRCNYLFLSHFSRNLPRYNHLDDRPFRDTKKDLT